MQRKPCPELPRRAFSASVTSVRAGDTVVLKRGDGMRDLCETFSEEGILLDDPRTCPPRIAYALSVAAPFPSPSTFRAPAAVIVAAPAAGKSVLR